MIAINSVEKAMIGQFGFIIKLDLSALLFDKVTGVQVGNYPTLADPQVLGTFPQPVTGEIPLATLTGYLNSSNAPRLAFNHSYNEVAIFCKNTDGISTHAEGKKYNVGDYVKVAGIPGIFVCITAGVSDADDTSIVWTVTGTITEVDGVQWQFVDYYPLADEIEYSANSLLVIFGNRNTQNCISDTDRIDIPDKDFKLFLNYALANFWNIKKQHIPIKIQNIIDEEELRIINESN